VNQRTQGRARGWFSWTMVAFSAATLSAATSSAQTETAPSPGGATHYLPKFSGLTTIVNSGITEFNGHVGIGVVPAGASSPLTVRLTDGEWRRNIPDAQGPRRTDSGILEMPGGASHSAGVSACRH